MGRQPITLYNQVQRRALILFIDGLSIYEPIDESDDHRIRVAVRAAAVARIQQLQAGTLRQEEESLRNSTGREYNVRRNQIEDRRRAAVIAYMAEIETDTSRSLGKLNRKRTANLRGS